MNLGRIVLLALALLNFTSCFGGKMKFYRNEEVLAKDMLAKMKNQYGIDFEIGTWRDGDNDFYYIKGADFEFSGIVQPASISERDKKSHLFDYYTVYNSTGDFKTHAHVGMFEKQLRADVCTILNGNGIKYSFLEFRGMNRNVSKWSKDSTYEDYKASKDYESWIYIKLPQAKSKDPEECQNEFAKAILPIMKKMYTLLEPEYNPTVVFYVDEYKTEWYDPYEEQDMKFEEKNCHLISLDLSKFDNYLDWTERDIVLELSPYEIEWLDSLELDD